MTNHHLTQQAIERYVAALGATQYHVRLLNFQTDQAKPVIYTATQLTDPKTVAYLRWQNSLGFDVYARPVGWQYVLLDDLTLDALTRIKADELRPCLLLETSPGNYQAWVILAECPTDREGAKTICRAMAQTYQADLCSAEPDHVGRLPGLTNRKAKYRQANGQFPFVRLHGATHRLSHFSTPSGGCVLNDPPVPPSGTTETPSYPLTTVSQGVQLLDRQAGTPTHSFSEHDFGIVIGLVRKGWDDDRIAAHLVAHSPNLSSRKKRYTGKYIARTIEKARKVAG
ncbi:hypothetical protein J2I47_00865 [Fibrella sp. HMF5335]|uniref:RepB-like DNA primase domain-containing protein n=1 Tax=Fibrella rubiginis TaxID=2817060 RepID=A0A939GDZ6_9BACT|nr:DNA-primase RepB domain-containing protein [Fibrella rubiginis]MBO0935085.1 hypothetical protein [Fibrella rubiginis]